MSTAVAIGVALGNPVGLVALATIGAVALVTGGISGADKDSVGEAIVDGVASGITQGASAGGGVVLTALKVKGTITTAQLLVGNTTINVITANISVVFDGHGGNKKIHGEATAIAVIAGILGPAGELAQGGETVAGEEFIPTMFALNGELWTRAACSSEETPASSVPTQEPPQLHLPLVPQPHY